MRGAIGIVGRGKIASALMGEWERRSDPEHRLLLCDSPTDMAGRADIVIVDAGPTETQAALDSLRPLCGSDRIIVSGIPGVTLLRLREVLGSGPVLFRAAASPGIGRGEGVTVLCSEPGTAPASLVSVTGLFERLGVVEVVPEDMLDAAVAVTGSSMGFFALALEGIEDGAVEAGLPRGTARAFVRQTALTAALLLRDHPGSPADLKDQVSSPGGTTIAGLAALEDRAARGAFIRAVEKASGKALTD